MMATRCSNSIGLAANSSHPAAMACSRSLSIAYADMPMIGMLRVCGSFLRDPHGFPAVSAWHFEVEQDYVRALARGQFAALLAVLSRENLEIANPVKAHLEHVEIVVVVFDVEHFGHSRLSSRLSLFNDLVGATQEWQRNC